MTLKTMSPVAETRHTGHEQPFTVGAPRFLVGCASFCVLLAVLAAVREQGWPLVHDAPLLHYVVFLMDHGKAPYRDIVEMNMPGSYMLERALMHTLGGGSQAWVAWDVITGLLAVAACYWIVGTGRRAVGLLSGALFYLVHASYGPMDLGQRDWVVAGLLLIAFGFLFQMLRSGRPVWMLGSLCALGFAASIKPPVVLVILTFLGIMLFQLRPLGRLYASLLWSLAGLALPTAAVAIFLAQWHNAADFLTILRGLVPWYASLQELGIARLLAKAVPLPLWVVLLGAVYTFWRRKGWRDQTSLILLGGFLAGLALFLLQRKGWSYHKYSTVAFGLLWSFYELGEILRSPPERRALDRIVAVLAVTVACAIVAPVLLIRQTTGRYPFGLESKASLSYSLRTQEQLQRDLGDLGGSALSGKVQCLDMTKGACISVLYRMGLVQSTGFIYDFYLFPRTGNAVTAGLQRRFLQEITSAPPRLLVLSSHTWPGDTFSYQQVDHWPAFQAFLAQQYTLVREFTGDPSAGVTPYRIYKLIGGNP